MLKQIIYRELPLYARLYLWPQSRRQLWSTGYHPLPDPQGNGGHRANLIRGDEVYVDRLVVKGFGRETNRNLPLPQRP